MARVRQWKTLLLVVLAAAVGLVAAAEPGLGAPGLVLLVGTVYAVGLSRPWRRFGVGHGIPIWRAAAFAGGLATIATGLLPPLEPMAEGQFSIHMVQHMLLIVVAAPLLVLGRPGAAMVRATPRGTRRWLVGVARRFSLIRGWRALSRPVTAWALHLVALWAWHLPLLYEAGTEHEAAHFLEHLTLLGSAALLWHAILAGRRPSAYGVSVLVVFATATQMNILSALLTFSHSPWYDLPPPRWGLTPLEDQQLAGLIMWIPGEVLYLSAAAALFALWLRATEREATRAEALAVESGGDA
ncbi:MAG: cytochrome c oxidase assembly protein [Dehalococcoidia bacterium]|nr:cytochrome c oxidase assembly protein [Dehalococcoidia bacterium]